MIIFNPHSIKCSFNILIITYQVSNEPVRFSFWFHLDSVSLEIRLSCTYKVTLLVQKLHVTDGCIISLATDKFMAIY